LNDAVLIAREEAKVLEEKRSKVVDCAIGVVAYVCDVLPGRIKDSLGERVSEVVETVRRMGDKEAKCGMVIAFSSLAINMLPDWLDIKIDRVKTLDGEMKSIMEPFFALAQKTSCPMDAIRVGAYVCYIAWRFTECRDLTQLVCDNVFAAVTDIHARYRPSLINVCTNQMCLVSMKSDMVDIFKILKRAGIKNVQSWADALEAWRCEHSKDFRELINIIGNRFTTPLSQIIADMSGTGLQALTDIIISFLFGLKIAQKMAKVIREAPLDKLKHLVEAMREGLTDVQFMQIAR
jgi:hypothetical protein